MKTFAYRAGGEAVARRRKSEIIIQTREALILYSPQSSCRGWCPACGSEQTLLLPEDAARATGVSVRALFRKLEEGTIHCQESPDGLARICAESLTRTYGRFPRGARS